MHGLILEDAAARRGFREVAHRHDHGVELDRGIGKDLVDQLIGPGRFDHIGELAAVPARLRAERRVLETRLGGRVPGGVGIRLVKTRIEAELVQILDKGAGARAPRSCDEKMPAHIHAMQQ